MRRFPSFLALTALVLLTPSAPAASPNDSYVVGAATKDHREAYRNDDPKIPKI